MWEDGGDSPEEEKTHINSLLIYTLHGHIHRHVSWGQISGQVFLVAQEYTLYRFS